MHSKVLWSLDNEVDPRTFEKICADIFFNEGYRNIIPLGGNYDNGRDAELLYYDENNELKIVFFQFSLESNWEKKLKRELVKLGEKHHVFHEYIFVTSQRVTGNKNDYYKEHILQKYGWDFKLFEREWLRIVLEEKYPQITKKYLEIEIDKEKRKQRNHILDFGVGDNNKDILSEIFMVENHYGQTELFKHLVEFDDLDLTNTRILINELLPYFYDICNALTIKGIMNFKGFELSIDQKEAPTKLVLSFGMGVPIRLLQRIILVLSNFQLEFLDFVDYRQEVYDSYLSTVEIGTYSYNDKNLDLIKLDQEMLKKLLDPSITANKFYSLVIQNVLDPCTDW